MKNLIKTIIALVVFTFKLQAQNSIPTTGNVGLNLSAGNTTTQLDVNGATRLRLAVEMSNNQFFAFNAYNNATAPAGWKYRVAGFASSFVQNAAGTFTFNLGNAASGAINTAVTWRPVYTILNSGNIGIGSITPDSRLDVVGNLAGKSNFRALGTAAKLTIDNNATGQNLYDAGLHLFRNNSGVERVRIDGATGSMGLGLSSAPLALLHLGGSSNKGLRINTVLNNAAFLGGWQDQAVLSVNRNAWDGTFTDATKTAASIQLEGLATGSNIQFLTSPTINTLQLERMRIIANGNVGIGLVTPAYPLDINGEMQSKGIRINAAAGYSALDYFSLEGANNAILGTVGAVNAIVNGSAVGDFVLRTTFKPILFSTDGGTTTHIKITNTGQVGIGTTTPTAKLEVSSGVANNSGLKFTNLNLSSPAIPSNGKTLSLNAIGEVILVNAASGGGGVAIDSVVRKNINFENGPGSFGTAQKMSILNNGNVGIGISTPTEKFEVNGSIKYRGQGDYINSATGFSAFGELFSSSDTYLGSMVKSIPNATGIVKTNNGLGSMISMQLTDGIRFHTNLVGATGTALTRASGEVMRINHAGNVGIGKSNPVSKLDVNGRGAFVADSSNIALQLFPNYNNKSQIQYLSSQANWYVGNSQGDFQFYNSNVPGGYAMSIGNNGNVGIGTNLAAYPLHVHSTPGPEKTLAAFRMTGGTKNPGTFFSSDETSGISAIHFSGSTGYQGRLRVGNTDVMSLVGTSVGVGTNTPEARLHVVGNHKVTGALDVISTTANRITGPGGDNWFPYSDNINYYRAVNHVFGDNLANERLRILSNGNVGIGVAAPTSKLEISSGTAGVSGLKFSNLNSTSTSIASNGKVLSVNTAGDVVLVNAGTTGSSADSLFRANFSVSGSYIGVGTTSPSSKFHIKSSTSAMLTLDGDSNGYGNAFTLYKANNGVNGRATGTFMYDQGGQTEWFAGRPYGNSDAFSIHRKSGLSNHNDETSAIVGGNGLATGVTSMFTINNLGNVGIGTTTPQSKLQVFNDKIIAGTGTSTTGTTVLEGQYDQAGTGGALSVLGTNYSTGGWMLGYGIRPKTGVNNSYISSNGGPLPKSAVMVDGDFRFMTSAAQSTLIGNDVTMLEKMRITNEGNVGIGITNPQQKLDINGNLRISSGWLMRPDNSGIALQVGNGTNIIYGNTAFNDIYGTTQRMLITESGNIGIGTSTPSSKLEINSGTAGFSGLKFSNLNSLSNTSTGKALGVNSTGEVILLNSSGTSGSLVDSTVRKNISFENGTGTFGNAQKISILNNGNVGIGTTSPTALLQIANRVKFNSDGTMNWGSAFDAGLLSWDTGKAIITGMSGKALSLGSDGIADKFYLSTNGNIGINTTTPTSKLDINGTTRLRGLIEMPTNTDFVWNAYYEGSWKYRSTGFSGGFYQEPGGALAYNLATSGVADAPITFNRAFTVLNNGNFGIGTSSPAQKLELSAPGDVGIRLFNTLANSWDIKNGTNGVLDFVRGTTNTHLRIDQFGNVGVGKTTPLAKLDVNGNVAIGFEGALAYPVGYKLAVDGNIIAKKVKVKNSSAWPDFVFEKTYKLPTLEEVATFIQENKHLPEIPSAAEVEKEGQDLGEMNRLLLKKVEELTLYMIEQNKKLMEVQKVGEQQQKEIDLLKKKK